MLSIGMTRQHYYDGTYDDTWDSPHIYQFQSYHRICTDLLVRDLLNSYKAENHRKILLQQCLVPSLSSVTAFAMYFTSSSTAILLSLEDNVGCYLFGLENTGL